MTDAEMYARIGSCGGVTRGQLACLAGTSTGAVDGVLLRLEQHGYLLYESIEPAGNHLATKYYCFEKV